MMGGRLGGGSEGLGKGWVSLGDCAFVAERFVGFVGYFTGARLRRLGLGTLICLTAANFGCGSW